MKKTYKKFLITMLSVAMAFTMSAMPVYADDAVIDDQETAAEVVLEAEAETVEAVDADEPVETATEIIEAEVQPEETAAEETVTEETAEPQEAAETAAVQPTVPEAVKPLKAAGSNAVIKAETNEAENSELDTVRKAIQALSVDPTDFTAADRDRVEAIKAQLEALSEEDQAILDAEKSHPGTSQSLGRVLEVALWAVWSYNDVDDSTALADGTYNASSTPALSSEYSKGKSTSGRDKPWSVKEVKVENGKATATITVESETYSGMWMGGKTYPNVAESGNCEFTGVPIDLNSTFYFAGISTSMPTPIAFSLTSYIDESGEMPAEDAADYTAVDEAIAKAEKIDRDLYTEESLKVLDDAIAAVDRAKTAEEQTEVDAMAKAIEDAIAALEKKEDGQEEGEKIDLTITNNTGMFKAVTAYLIKEEGKEYLVVALSGTTYRELHKGTYESAVENGDGTKENGNDSWIHGYNNAAGKVEFRIPVDEGESFIPCVAVSGTYYKNYLDGKNPIERSFYPRQFTIDKNAKTLVVDDYNETADFAVTSNVADFKVANKAVTQVVGGPNSNNYSVSPTLVMQDGTYDQVKYPTVKDGSIVDDTVSIKDGKFVISFKNAPAVEAFKDKEAIEMKFHVASDAPYKAAGQWVKRTMTIDKMVKTIVIDGTPLAEKDSDKQDDIVDPDKPIKPDEKSDDSGSGGDSGYAPAVDSSTTLADGVYTPDSFSWSGGTGKLTISCTKVTVRNGQAYATIVFSSSKVDQLKASGGLYYNNTGGNAVFEIPVNLNTNNTIVARTTAMSSPHWIEYTIYIGLAENEEQAEKAKEAKKDAAEAKMKISDEAPSVIGLEAKETKSSVEYSKYFKIFEYEHGVKMLSIDISDKTALKKMYTENAQKALEVSESEEDVEYDDEGKIIAKSKGEYIEALYHNNVVNYLLVPEDFEVPAGLDKEYIIINIPVEKSFLASPEAIALMEELGCTDALTLLGIDEKEIKSKDIKKAIKDEKIKPAGDVEKPDFAKVVKEKPGLAVLPGDLLPEEIDKDASASEKQKLGEEAMKMKEKLEKLESRFTALSVPVVIDRSAQEEEELAQAEWIKVYGALFGCDDEAKKIFDEKVKEAKKNGKN